MNGFDLSTISNCYIDGTYNCSIYIGNNLIWPIHDYHHEYFTIQSIADDNGINIVLETDTYSQAEIEYSYNGGTWTSAQLSSGTNTIRTINHNDTIRFRGFRPLYPEQKPSIQYTFDVGDCNVFGNLSSLWYAHIDTVNSTDTYYAALNETSILTNESYYRLFYKADVYDASNLILPATTLASSCYNQMFCQCYNLTTAPALPATTLAYHCYYCMFARCTSLTTAPALPATTLVLECYMGMFEGCTSLTTTPELPATTLAQGCYQSMFHRCTSLTTAPALPATILANNCYLAMFSGCTSLTTAPVLPATTLKYYCYQSMFESCTSLTTAPALPATTLANRCYFSMFYGCTSLTTAPVLPATTLTNHCYDGMFEGCISLTAAPALPATTLTDYCYQYMFYGCASLTTAPILPATTLADHCYQNMFEGCSQLNSITCLATDISATGCTFNWVNDVAATGTFTKDPNMTDWTTGISGIPSGWTVEDYSPLPYDYEVEYLQGDGKAYINLGIPISTFYNVDFELKFAPLQAKVCAFGGNDKSPTKFCQWVLLDNRRFRFDWADSGYTGFSSNQLTLGEPYILKQENGYLSINGTSRQITKTNPVSDNMTIFVQGNNPDSGSNAFDGRIYYFKCTSPVDDSLVYNYISVVKNGVPCMYDTVNGIFYYNARNEGAFTAGPRVSV